jgi:nucleoside-diphosphate-sugar epimerase
MKVVILGARGFIGSNLYEYLKKNKPFWETIPVSFYGNRFSNVMANTLSLDKVDLIIDCHWNGTSRDQRSDSSLQMANVSFVKDVIDYCRFSNIPRILMFGSQAELGNEPTPWDETTPMHPIDSYGEAKESSFKLLLDSSIEFCWIRLFSVYGPNDRRVWVLNSVLRALSENRPIELGSCSQVWPLTYVEDVCEGVVASIDLNLSGIVNLSHRSSCLLRESLEMLQEISGRKNLLQFGEDKSLVRDLVISETRLEKLGVVPRTPLEEGLLRVWEGRQDLFESSRN